MRFNFYGFLFCVFVFNGAASQNITLEDVIAVAIEKNYDVRVLQTTSAIAANDNRYAYGAFIPQINANGSYTKNNNDSRTVTFTDLETIRTGAKSTTTNGSVQLLWTLFDGTKNVCYQETHYRTGRPGGSERAQPDDEYHRQHHNHLL